MAIEITGYNSFAKLTFALSADISDAVEDFRKSGHLEPGISAKQQTAFLDDLLKLSDQLFLISGHADTMAERIQKQKLKSLN